MKQTRDIYFRADGDSQIGLGHVIRSLALVDMLNQSFNCHFIIRQPSPYLQAEIRLGCKSIITLAENQSLEEEADYLSQHILCGHEILVLDGYHFQTSYQEILRQKLHKLLCIDDIHAYHFVADAVINHIGGISPKAYATETYTQLYLGPDYALLRAPFRLAAQESVQHKPEAQAIFICLGGADPKNASLAILKDLESCRFFPKCYLVIGSAYRHQKELNSFLAENHYMEVQLLSGLSASEMVFYMQKCERAITSPSSISYEYLSVGGRLYLYTIAENQQAVYDYLISAHFAFPYQCLFTDIRADVATLASAASPPFDGCQASRFLSIFNQLAL